MKYMYAFSVRVDGQLGVRVHARVCLLIHSLSDCVSPFPPVLVPGELSDLVETADCPDTVLEERKACFQDVVRGNLYSAL